MSDNAIKLLNTRWISEQKTNSEYEQYKNYTRVLFMQHIAAKIIGAGC